ncbi:integrase catalytic domain-containing protein [Pseudarthrobacter cellobiosi]|uniref:integrase catalytic domain-containing protein n=1 Tax=Pseudarthrobacter cellobiosi TaxID=2953654 RepID=UPI00208F01F9|nr:transposase family protein [Pseudarthrobacter sp. HLT1-5]MCO4256998.1 transposase family protein [Pseudarthrobacter sp. HLT1-5]
MSERRAVTKVIATRYARAGRAVKKQILDELCATTGWHRDHTRKSLRHALVLKPVRPRAARAPLYGEPVIEALRFCWAVQGTLCGRLLAAALPDLVPRLRRFKELRIDTETAAQLLRIAPDTIDRRLKADQAKLEPRGRSHTKPGTLLKDSIPIRTWAEWDDAVPGFVEIDLVGHEGGNSQCEFCFTLDITDIATGWTETRSVINKAQKWVFAAIKDATAAFPFPVLGLDSDNGSEFINWELFRWCEQENLTFTRSRSGNKNDGAHVEQKNWHIVRQTVGYHRYDTAGELELLNRIWALQRLLTNHFGPQQKLLTKVRSGAKTSKTYDSPATPFQRILADSGTVSMDTKARLKRENKPLNPAAIQRQIQALSAELLTLSTAKRAPDRQPTIRAKLNDSSKQPRRAS